MSKIIVYNDDGWSSYMRYPAPASPEDIVRTTVEPIAGTAVKVYQFCALGGHAVNYNSKFLPRVGEMMDNVGTMHVWRMRETLRHLDSLGTDPLRIITDACHDRGIACQFSLRMNDAHHVYKLPDGSWYFPELQSPWFDEHPEALLPSRQVDYASPVVHEYRKKQIQEILDRYGVDGIDLDFTRFKPWFQTGKEDQGRPLMTRLVTELREMTRRKNMTLSARFEYDPQMCVASGLDVERWLADGLFDQITLGGIGDHTPDAPSDWFVTRAHARGAKVYPSMEGQLHWCPACGGGGTGTHAGNGVHDGYGPPSEEYMRAFAALHYDSGADGISLFNFTCADGPFSLSVLEELANPQSIKYKDKQYVVATWPWDAQIYYVPWTSKVRLAPEQKTVSLVLRIADDPQTKSPRSAVLTLDLMGLNRLNDVEVYVNGTPVEWNGYHYNHYDHGCWNDVVQFTVPARALRHGENIVELRRMNDTPGFTGAIEVRKCILDVKYANSFAPGRV